MAERIEAGARVYATALYEAAVDAGKVDEVDRDLAAVAGLFDESLALHRTMLDPQLPHDAKKRVIGRLMPDAEPLARNALMVLVDNGRLAFLHDIQVAFHEMSAVEERILDVEVTSAVPLEQAEVDRIQERISTATGLTARLAPSVDPTIIGGLVLRARGVLLDASVKRELDDLRLALTTTPLPTGSEA
jgi:F-type H+-transporting ATPase subunit delta